MKWQIRQHRQPSSEDARARILAQRLKVSAMSKVDSRRAIEVRKLDAMLDRAAAVARMALAEPDAPVRGTAP